MKRNLSCLLLIGLQLLTSALVKAVPEKEQVLRLLEGRHWELHEGVFQRLGSGTDQVLREIADDPGLINYLRFRALEALSLYDNEATARHLERLVKSQDPTFALRGFSALSRGFSKTQPERVRIAGMSLLTNPDAHVRIEAARAIRSLDEPAFQSFLSTESEPWVRMEARK